MDATFTAIKEAIDNQGKAFDVFKKTNDERLEALNKGNDAKAKELDVKLGKIEVDIKNAYDLKKAIEIEMQLQRERLEELEARSKSPIKTQEEKQKSEYKTAFFDWLRDDSADKGAKLKALERKDVTIGTGSAGGFAVPEEISREISRLEMLFSPVRRIVKVRQTGTSDYKELVDLQGQTGGWVGETGTRSATNTPVLREVAPTHGELYAYPQVSEWSLDDIFFNVENWIAEASARIFAQEEGIAVISGNGTNKPTGLLNTAPVSTADGASPLRAAAAYQFIACNNSPIAITADCLITLLYTVRAPYRPGSVWVANSATIAAIRKLKDTTNQYLWQPSLQAAEPDRLLGYPFEVWEQMQDIGANNHPVAFGNFGLGYVLTDRVGLRITRDQVTNIGFVKFYIRRREGGIPLNNDAIKFLKTT